MDGHFIALIFDKGSHPGPGPHGNEQFSDVCRIFSLQHRTVANSEFAPICQAVSFCSNGFERQSHTSLVA